TSASCTAGCTARSCRRSPPCRISTSSCATASGRSPTRGAARWWRSGSSRPWSVTCWHSPSARNGRRTWRASHAACETRHRTHGRTLMENTNLDLIALIQQGAISTYPLLACSILMLGVAIERLWSLRGAVSSTAALTAKLVPLVARGDLTAAAEAVRQHRLCPARRVFNDVLQAAPNAPLEDVERVADERQFEEVQASGAYLWVLGTIGSSAPFIGLFGTVLGIIRAFHSMALAGTGG